MKDKSVWENMTPQQRKEFIAYTKEEYPYIPKWALRFHAPKKKLSEAPEELKAMMEKLEIDPKFFGYSPDEKQEEALREYVNSIQWVKFSPAWKSDKIIEAYLLSGENLMNGEYIYKLCERETAPKGHSFSIHPKEYWGRVEAKRKADISSFVKSRRDRLLSAYIPIVEDAIKLFTTLVRGTEAEPIINEKIKEYGLQTIAESEMEAIESLALNYEIAVNWEELEIAEEIKKSPDFLFELSYFLPLISDFRESIIAGICSDGKEYLQRIDRGTILSELEKYYKDLSKVDKNR